MKNLRKQHNGKGGFTLIEILVVMAIIGILLATAVPAIIGQIQKQKEGASAAKAHNLAIAAFSYSNDNNQVYPYGNKSETIFTTLYAGKYLTQPADVFLTEPGKSVFSASEQTLATQGVQAANVSWDFTTEQAGGLTGTDPTDTPMILSDVINAPNLGNGPVYTTTTAVTPWGTDGVTMCTMGQQASFVRPSGTQGCQLAATSFAPPTGVTYVVQVP